MENSEGYELKLLSAHRAYYRGGGLLKQLLSKKEKHLSGKEALSIFNTYGIPPYELKLLLMSHGFEFDESDFVELIIKQKEISKNMRQCIDNKNASDGN